MTDVVFTLSGGKVSVTGFREGTDAVRFTAEDGAEGFLRIDRKTLPLTNGRCRFPISELPAGEFTPLFITNDACFPLPRFFRTENTVRLCAPSGEEFHDLLDRVRRLEAHTEEDRTLLTALREKVFGTFVFRA